MKKDKNNTMSKTGREKFNKYKRVINIFTSIVSVFPLAVRKWLFFHGRMYQGNIGLVYRYILFKTMAKECGDNVAIFPGVYMENIDKISVGNNVSIHGMCYLDGEGRITIGNNVSIAHRTTIVSSTHTYKEKNIPIKYQKTVAKPVEIKDDCWIGCSVSILAGVTVGSGSVIGANSVVTKSVPSNVVVAGNPARVIKER